MGPKSFRVILRNRPLTRLPMLERVSTNQNTCSVNEFIEELHSCSAVWDVHLQPTEMLKTNEKIEASYV